MVTNINQSPLLGFYFAQFRTTQLYLVCVVLFFCVFPLFPTISDAYFNDNRFGLIVILSSLCFYISLDHFKTRLAQDRMLSLALILILSGMALTVISQQLDKSSLLFFLNFVLLLLFSVSISLNSKLYQWQFFSKVILVITIALTAVMLLNLVFNIVLEDALNLFAILVEFENIRHFNQLQVLTLPLILYLCQDRKFNNVASITLTLYLLMLLLTAGRGALAAWLLVVLLIFWNKNTRDIASKALIATSIAALLYTIIIFAVFGDGYTIARLGSSYRSEMWLELIAQLSWHNIFVGYGGGNYPLHTKISAMAHPHNVILQMLSEWGLIALIGFMLFFGSIFSKNFHLLFTKRFTVASAIFLSWCAGLLYSLVDGVFVMPIGQMLIFLYSGFLLKLPSTRAFNCNLISNTMLQLLLLVTCSLFMLLSVSYFHQQINNDIPFFGPSYWLVGDVFK
ncbi:O-antigen ligase family protein [Rheinheimera sp.]|uniref:O-antigen ligase family protein n=1 Tax=Rheinheimera sp. TaxID=1869214 RepID=UPI00404793D9